MFEIDYHEAIKLSGLGGFNNAVFGYYLVSQLIRFQNGREIDPNAIIREIMYLEGCASYSLTKKPKRFTSGKMVGFWHKHFFEARHIPFNVAQHHTSAITGDLSPSAERIINRIFDPSRSDYVTRDMIHELSQAFSVDAFEQRSKQRSLTGDWIIFKKHEGKNHYLCVCPHDVDTDELYDRLCEKYLDNMPFLFSKY